MPNLESAKKRIRADEKKRLRNKPVLSLTRTNIRKAEELISSGQSGEAQNAVLTAVSSLDRAAKKGVIHTKNAARRKSRLMKKMNQSQQSPSAE